VLGLGVGPGGTLFVPLLVGVAGVAVIWRQADDDRWSTWVVRTTGWEAAGRRAVGALLVVVAAFLRMLSRRVGVVLAAVLLVATVVGTGVQATSSATPVKEDYRGAAELLEAKVTPSDLVVVSSPFTIWPFERYYDGDARVVTLPEWDRRQEGGLPAFDEAALPAQVDELVAGHQRVYLLLSYDQGYEDAVEQYFRSQYQQVYAQEVSPGMQLVGFRTGYSQNSPVEDQQRTAPRR